MKSPCICLVHAQVTIWIPLRSPNASSQVLPIKGVDATTLDLYASTNYKSSLLRITPCRGPHWCGEIRRSPFVFQNLLARRVESSTAASGGGIDQPSLSACRTLTVRELWHPRRSFLWQTTATIRRRRRPLSPSSRKLDLMSHSRQRLVLYRCATSAC